MTPNVTPSSGGRPLTGKPVGGTADQRLIPRKRKSFLGPQPLGLLFSAPYVIYVLAVLAFPLGYAVYMSFHDFFFTAPRVKVDRPFVGFENYIAVLSDPAVQRSFSATTSPTSRRVLRSSGPGCSCSRNAGS